ncbi:hypothetical protein OXX59_007812, partial [Metschnikowia pulcherrima]
SKSLSPAAAAAAAPAPDARTFTWFSSPLYVETPPPPVAAAPPFAPKIFRNPVAFSLSELKASSAKFGSWLVTFLLRFFKKTSNASAPMRMAPPTAPTTPPIILPFFCDTDVPPESGEVAAVGIVTSVVIVVSGKTSMVDTIKPLELEGASVGVGDASELSSMSDDDVSDDELVSELSSDVSSATEDEKGTDSDGVDELCRLELELELELELRLDVDMVLVDEATESSQEEEPSSETAEDIDGNDEDADAEEEEVSEDEDDVDGAALSDPEDRSSRDCDDRLGDDSSKDEEGGTAEDDRVDGGDDDDDGWSEDDEDISMELDGSDEAAVDEAESPRRAKLDGALVRNASRICSRGGSSEDMAEDEGCAEMEDATSTASRGELSSARFKEEKSSVGNRSVADEICVGSEIVDA